MSPAVPAVPEGTDLGVVVWGFVVLVGAGIAAGVTIVRLLVKEFEPIRRAIGRVENATNHTAKGEPTLVENAAATRLLVERLDTDVRKLSEWFDRWDELPDELRTDRGLVHRFEQLDEAVAAVHEELVEHVRWEMSEKYRNGDEEARR